MLEELKEDVVGIGRILFKRDFSGNRGLAVKNSIYQTATGIVAKIGSLLFTIIIARMLLPDLFGLYSLALSTIVLFTSFCELGIGTALIKYVAQKGKKSRGYIQYLGRLKLYLTAITVLILSIFAYSISNYYYQKPIFYALI